MKVHQSRTISGKKKISVKFNLESSLRKLDSLRSAHQFLDCVDETERPSPNRRLDRKRRSTFVVGRIRRKRRSVFVAAAADDGTGLATRVRIFGVFDVLFDNLFDFRTFYDVSETQ